MAIELGPLHDEVDAPAARKGTLDQLSDVVEMIEALSTFFLDGRVAPFPAGEMHCPVCGDVRRMLVRAIHMPVIGRAIVGGIAARLPPTLLSYTCVQCSTGFTALIYAGPDGPELAVLQSCRGGLTTPHTPQGVAYYLDQAQRAQSVGARSAAIAMYRSALEHLLYEQGYKKGMLAAKIDNLEKDIQAKTAPKWAMEIDTEFLDLLKELGNASIHPNDGDIDKQAALHGELLADVKHMFQMLLYSIYEVSAKKQKLLDSLRAAKRHLLKK